ncbi:uncharacterized protein LOC117522365 [Thalassophryne amazonica]|uniref:uncharacterized protein LOC117522365 n=1 Tax=Thalassophryne amazonica TaxID=390379 RepID=UPI001470D432|nr:uncharacterized protein LOC117522365 [Thalassophryne amazonica]
MGTLPLLFISLVFLRLIEGSVDVTPVFVQTGGDVLLDGHKPSVLEDGFVFSWKINDTNIIRFLPPREPIFHKSYEERAEFTAENFSLLLKDLQKADSGLYVGFIQGDKDRITAQYNVIVVDPVSPVVLQVDSVSNTSVSCDITLTCSTNDSDIIILSANFTCQKQTCSLWGGQGSKVTPSVASLHIYMSNGFIICNHSNQVSKTNATKKIDQVCPQNAGPPPSSGLPLILTLAIVVVVTLLLVLVGVCCRASWQVSFCTACDVYQTELPASTECPGPPKEASDVSPFSTYSLVGLHTGPTRSTEAAGNTLYAEVQKGKRPREENAELLPSNQHG